MRPSFSYTDGPHSHFSDWVVGGDCPECFAASPPPPDFSNLRFGNLRSARFLPALCELRIALGWVGMATFLNFIVHVVRERARKQMVRANTRRIIATMADLDFASGGFAKNQRIDKSMGKVSLISKIHISIAAPMMRAVSVFPAFTRDHNAIRDAGKKLFQLWLELSPSKMFGQSHVSLLIG